MNSKLLLGLVAAGSLFVFTNCKTTQVAKFSSVENVMKLELNSTLPEVVSTLGTQPYNIYSKQVDGYTIYVYKYKLVERKVSPDIVNSRGGETTGTEVYNGKEHDLFLFFKDGKLVSMVTSDGRKDSPALIMLENTMYTITREKGEYIIVPTSTAEATSEPSLPFGGKRK